MNYDTIEFYPQMYTKSPLSEYYDNMQEEMRVIYNKVEKVVNGRRVI